MTSISSHTLHPRTAQAIKVSRSWSLQALQIADGVLAQSGSTTDPSALVCNRAKAIALHNMGMLTEVRIACPLWLTVQIGGDLPAALGYFDKSMAVSKEIGFAEGRREAMEAIRGLRNQGISEPIVPGR
jgi:hypothetical protein